MTIKSLSFTITGVRPLLLNNPQCVDRFNGFTKRIKIINDKKTRRTEEDYLELADLEVASKLYFNEELGVYVPTSWVTEAIASTAFKVAKVSKATIRGSLFAVESKTKLSYDGMNTVKEASDIVKNPKFRHSMILPQQQVRINKAFPVFHKWSFSLDLEYDDSQIDRDSVVRVLNHCATYGGFGDFRPTFGRASCEVTNG